ncbi:MAG: SigE family RNA polymerase sigma factor [Mycobacteriales bacterium]
MDAEAERRFREFVAGRSAALFRLAYVLTGDYHQAEDLLQTALTRTAAHWRRVEDPDAYVRTTLYRLRISGWRRHARHRETSPGVLPERPVPDSADQVVLRVGMYEALRRLTPKQRAVLVLRYFEDLPEREVAEVLGCSVGTVRSQTARALAKLRATAGDFTVEEAQP